MANSRICSISDCGKPVHSRGWCQAHYRLWGKYGTPLKKQRPVKIPNEPAPRKIGKLMQFILETAIPHTSEECLIWPYAKTREGYGKTYYLGRHKGAHRVVCELAHGQSQDGNQAAHTCGKPSCVNPNHLRWATPRQNAADKDTHGTAQIAEAHPRAKLCNSDVVAIRSAKGKVTNKSLADQYGVASSTIAMIQSGRNWKTV